MNLKPALLCIALAGCASTGAPTSPQTVLNTTASTCQKIDAAIVATDSAIVSKVLKGQAAKDAVTGLAAAQAGCVAALAAMQAAPAASGASK